MTDVPGDIRPCWFNPIRRLQSVALQQTGLAILTIRILVNEAGEPVQWTDPDVALLEPKKSKEAILRLMGK